MFGLWRIKMNWIKDKWIRFKKWIFGVLTTLGIITIAVAATRGPVIISEQDFLTVIEQLQEQNIQTNNKYLQFKLNEKIGDLELKDFPYEIQIHEYVSPKGPGYQIILTREIDTGKISSSSQEPIMQKQIKSVGYGPEAQSRTYDWR